MEERGWRRGGEGSGWQPLLAAKGCSWWGCDCGWGEGRGEGSREEGLLEKSVEWLASNADSCKMQVGGVALCWWLYV